MIQTLANRKFFAFAVPSRYIPITPLSSLQRQFLENLIKHSDGNSTDDLVYDAWLYPRGNSAIL